VSKSIEELSKMHPDLLTPHERKEVARYLAREDKRRKYAERQERQAKREAAAQELKERQAQARTTLSDHRATIAAMHNAATRKQDPLGDSAVRDLLCEGVEGLYDPPKYGVHIDRLSSAMGVTHN
jgi:chromatin segregation and condensation protein Rec8/ScpA/Scc1 (kleisin family)